MLKELNLLPPDRLRSLYREAAFRRLNYFARGVAAALLVVTLSGGIAAGGLQFLTLTARGSAANALDQEVDKYQKIREQVAQENTLLESMKLVADRRIIWSDYTHELLGRIPVGITVLTMVGNAANAELTFTGNAGSRNTLIVTEDRLKVLPWVESVNAPHANLVQRFNPLYSFELQLKGAPETTTK